MHEHTTVLCFNEPPDVGVTTSTVHVDVHDVSNPLNDASPSSDICLRRCQFLIPQVLKRLLVLTVLSTHPCTKIRPKVFSL